MTRKTLLYLIQKGKGGDTKMLNKFQEGNSEQKIIGTMKKVGRASECW